MLYFKKSITDLDTIKVLCRSWMSYKDGICARTENGYEYISTKDLYFVGSERV